MVFGIAIHHIPAAFALASVLMSHQVKGNKLIKIDKKGIPYKENDINYHGNLYCYFSIVMPDINDLYDKNIVIMFHAKSNKKPKVGKGSGEIIPITRMIEFNKLNKITDWRRKLCDDWMTPFTLDGKRWGSVKHYYLGSQYKKGFPDFSKEFSLDSESEISKNIDIAKAASDSGKYKKRILRKCQIKNGIKSYRLLNQEFVYLDIV